MEDLVVTLVQSDIHWRQTEANLSMFEEKLWAVSPRTDLIVLPEMFNTGFTMQPDHLSEPMNGKTFRWMKGISQQFKAVVAGSLIVSENGEYYNRLIWMFPDGHYGTYDKRHLFRISGEDKIFSRGTRQNTFQIKGWQIRPLICYDLRFPVWSRNRHLPGSGPLDFDLVMFVANWPMPRIMAWEVLLKARAIENQSYAIGVNRTGRDGEGISYNGHSIVVDYRGIAISELGEKEAIETVVLSYKDLAGYRDKFPFYLDADPFEILE